jgi:hypothetical protein
MCSFGGHVEVVEGDRADSGRDDAECEQDCVAGPIRADGAAAI